MTFSLTLTVQTRDDDDVQTVYIRFIEAFIGRVSDDSQMEVFMSV